MRKSIPIFTRATYWLQYAALVLRRLALVLLTIVPLSAASEQAQPAAAQGVLEVFVRDGCPYCAEAKIFLARLSSERPGLRIIYRSVDSDASARSELEQRSRNAGIWPPGVPTFVVGGRILVGFDDAERSGPALLALIDQASAPSPGQVETRLFGTLSASRLGLPLFTLAVGLLDGFNPCAMWVLLLLLSLLVRLHDRKRMALVAGTFVLVSGAVYYAFMTAWLNIFLVAGMSAPLRWTLAGMAFTIGVINVKDFFVRERRLSLSIPDSAKRTIHVL